MERYFFIMLTVLLGLVSCMGRHKAEATGLDDTDSTEMMAETRQLTPEEELDDLIAQEPLPTAADELFDDFIFNFASNQRLQRERIVFPLLVSSGAKQEYVEASEWKMEHFFIHQGQYTLMFDSEEQMELVKDTTVSHVVIEKIFLDDDFVRQYLFDRNDGRWMLREIRNQTLLRNPNASFIVFYHQFATDSLFQRESLAEEIVFQGPDPDDDFERLDGVITPDFWDAFAPELPQSMLFNVVYSPQNPASTQKIFVVRGISNGLEQELTFKQQNGVWKLVKLVE